VWWLNLIKGNLELKEAVAMKERFGGNLRLKMNKCNALRVAFILVPFFL
jgi:hypothetical protein